MHPLISNKHGSALQGQCREGQWLPKCAMPLRSINAHALSGNVCRCTEQQHVEAALIFDLTLHCLLGLHHAQEI